MSLPRPRLLALLGSGETAPTLVGTHRELVARFGSTGPRAVLLDTPYGFQENAAEISRRTVAYFAARVQLAIEVAGFPGPLAADPDERGTQPTPAALARLRAASLVFAGPGSPSYALSVWQGSPVPAALADKLAHGGAVVCSSAAALTLGRFTLPVYEIYKVGAPPHWLPGLDLLAALPLPGDCAVIPHFDNAEGGTHDTRFCYMGARRLDWLEAALPEAGWILGVDEHTALLLDVGAGTARVTGRGGVTVRCRGQARRFPAGSTLGLVELTALVTGRAAGPGHPPAPNHQPPADSAPPTVAPPRRSDSPLLAEVARLERAFEDALATHRAADAAGVLQELDRAIAEWASDSLQSDAPDRARAVLHALIHRLGTAAALGGRDPREPLAPLVDALIALRAELRAERAWGLADRLRACLAGVGIELRDTPAGTDWTLATPGGRSGR